MSNDKPTVVTTAPAETDTTVQIEEKRPNVLVRAARAIKREPKTTLAVVAGTALVAGSAFLGRKTAPLHIQIVESDIELEPVLQTPDTSDDTKSA
jgi:hypothetical protein